MFTWIVFKSRADRDRVNAKVMKDPRLAKMMDPKKPIFDCKRMVYGGFNVRVDAWQRAAMDDWGAVSSLAISASSSSAMLTASSDDRRSRRSLARRLKRSARARRVSMSSFKRCCMMSPLSSRGRTKLTQPAATLIQIAIGYPP